MRVTLRLFSALRRGVSTPQLHYYYYYKSSVSTHLSKHSCSEEAPAIETHAVAGSRGLPVVPVPAAHGATHVIWPQLQAAHGSCAVHQMELGGWGQGDTMQGDRVPSRSMFSLFLLVWVYLCLSNCNMFSLFLLVSVYATCSIFFFLYEFRTL